MNEKYEIVIPAWNAEEFVAETIESLQRQSHPPTLITVIDDGSTDGTAEICGKMGVQVISGPRNGVVAARNLGLEHVRERLVAFVDADDLWDDSFGYRVVEVFGRESQSVSTVSTLVRPFGDSDLSAWWGPKPDPGTEAILGPTDVWQGNPVTASAAMHRTSWLTRIGGWREGLTPTDDYDLVLRLVAEGANICRINERLGSYRVRNGSWSSRISASIVSETRALTEFDAKVGATIALDPDLNKRLQQLWWRSAARAARYDQTFDSNLAFPAGCSPSYPMRLAQRLSANPTAFSLASKLWRNGFARR